MRNSKISTHIALIALFVLLAFSRHSTADLIDPDPVRLLEAQQMALDVSGQLRPPADLTEQIYNDLAAIRSSYPEFADITYRPHATPYQIIVGLTQQAAEEFRNGEFHALDELNDLYGPVTIGPLRGSDRHPYIILQFEQLYNTELLSAIYAQAEGVRYAEPNHYFGDRSTIDADPPFYTFIRAWGDCPAGCMYREFYYFKVEDGGVTIPDERYVDALDGDDDNYGLTPEKAFATIQAAIDVAVDGDTVIVADGTYTGEGNRDIDFLGKAITLRSQSGPENCIIDCQGTQDQPHRALYFHSGEGQHSAVDGFTIMNGYASSTSPHQSEWSGGGILCRQSSPTIRNCIITNNTTLNGTGGGIRAAGSTIITDCTLKANYAIGLQQYGPGGGGISCGGNATVSNCIITANTAQCDGGGIMCTAGSPTIINCTIAGNSAGGGGGIACHWWADALISNCTISGNVAASAGGGISSLDSSPTLVNCILWGDNCPFGPEISSYCLYGSFPITVSYSNVQGGRAQADVASGCALLPCTPPDCNLNWGPGNIDADPCFVDPGYWADANDPNIIVEPNDPNAVWVDGDYYLLPNSPCIDAGDPNYVPEPNETDLDGKPRISGEAIDMGAYEFGSLPAVEAVVKIRPRTLNLSSKGKWITCRISLPEDYNVADIDPDTVFLEDEIPADRVWLVEEFAVVKFSRSALQELLVDVDTPTKVELLISGQLNDGTKFEGTDTIRLIKGAPRRKNRPRAVTSLKPKKPK